MDRFQATLSAGRRHCRSREDSLSPWFRAEPPREEIAALAYSYWESRGRMHGSDVEDWLRAERELRARCLLGE